MVLCIAGKHITRCMSSNAALLLVFASNLLIWSVRLAPGRSLFDDTAGDPSAGGDAVAQPENYLSTSSSSSAYSTSSSSEWGESGPQTENEELLELMDSQDHARPRLVNASSRQYLRRFRYLGPVTNRLTVVDYAVQLQQNVVFLEEELPVFLSATCSSLVEGCVMPLPSSNHTQRERHSRKGDTCSGTVHCVTDGTLCELHG